jgi:hypothetical protein
VVYSIRFAHRRALGGYSSNATFGRYMGINLSRLVGLLFAFYGGGSLRGFTLTC